MQDWQTLVLAPLLVAAGIYVARWLWSSIRPQSGCGSCRHNTHRSDDYA